MTAPRRKPTVMLLFGWNDPEGFAAVSNYAREHGWHLELRAYFTDTVPDHWKGDGILYSKGNRERMDRFVIEQSVRCPVVSLNANLPFDLEVPIVSPDNREAGAMAARHLIAQGHRDFAFYSPVGGTVAGERRHGFEEVIGSHGLHIHDLGLPWKIGKPVSWSVQRKRLSGQLLKLPPRVGLLALDDLMAADLIEVAVECGLKVPENLAVVGLGNLAAVCQCSPIPITSIDLRAGEIARHGAALLGKLMSGGRNPSAPILIPPGELIVRESSDTTIVKDPRLAQAVGFIRKNLLRPLSLDQIAEKAGVSRRTLYQLFQAGLGLTPAEYLRRQRTQIANRLMREQPDLTRDEAARMSGFTCTRTLSRRLGSA